MTINISNYADLLRWWHQYQAQMLNHEADMIRNGVLQDMFAIRRRLELSCLTQPNAEEFGCEDHLAKLRRIYILLENLSDRLELPYLQESLPLALQHAVQPWRESVRLRARLPHTWEAEPVEHTRLLVMLAENLLQHLATAAISPRHCDITLQHQFGVKELTFHMLYRESPPASLTEQTAISMKPFLETFQILTQGDYSQDLQARSLTWALRWKT